MTDDDFPESELGAAGYRSRSYGQKAYNGVAVLTRAPSELAEPILGFGGDPVPDESRVLSGSVDGLKVVDIYAVNGKSVGDPAYGVKLQWFEALTAWLDGSSSPKSPLVVAGDFNVAPTDLDVHDPPLWSGKNLASDPEREQVRRLLDWGLVDLGRVAAGHETGPFTWWDYRMGAFHRGWGLRIDLVLGTKAVADRLVSVEVDRQERKPTAGEGKPSDHAPVIVTLAD